MNKMDNNTCESYIFVLRSMSFYGRKKPAEQYTQNTYKTWLASHGAEETEIKKIYNTFGFGDIPRATYAYFKFKADNHAVLDRYELEFLRILEN